MTQTRTVPGIDLEEFCEAFRQGDLDKLDDMHKPQDDALFALYREFENGDFRTLSYTQKNDTPRGTYTHVDAMHKSTRRGVLYQISFYIVTPTGEIWPIRHVDVNDAKRFRDEYAGANSDLVFEMQ